MKRHLGRASLIAGLSCWGTLLAAMLLGGLDPSPTYAAVLRAISMTAVVLALGSVCLGIAAVARGPQRLAGSFGLAVSLRFLLYFTGMGFFVA